MLTKKWMVATCILLTAFVLASCGKQGDTAVRTTETAIVVSGTEDSSNIEESGNNTAVTADDSTNTNEGDANGGDFALTGEKWEWIYWDGDQDGEEEQISFEYVDNGDEAENFILVTLEVGGSSEAYIDRAGRIVRIFDKEDEEGPFLLVEYNYENVLSEKADMKCIVRLHDGAVVVEGIEEIGKE